MSMSPNVTSFLVRLRKVDKLGLTVRDVLVLYAIIENPGADGLTISTKLGLRDRSALASNLHRLERIGFIEDRREKRQRAVPAALYPLEHGIAFWEEIKPE